jgi:hypothetical protein
MTVPSPVPFSSLKQGDVFQFGGTTYLMKVSDTQAVRLEPGEVASMPSADAPCVFLPAARLVLG